jgi:hypothetical protein
VSVLREAWPPGEGVPIMPRPTRATYDFRREVEAYLSGGTYDSLRQPLYDRVTVTAGALLAGTVFSFFALPIGQGTPVKTQLDTNLNLAGQLPANHVLEVWSPRIVVHPVQPSNIAAATAANVLTDVDNFLHNSFFTFNIVSQQKLLCPTFYLPAGAGIAGFANTTAAAVEAQYATNGTPSQESPQRLDPFPVIVPPLQTFLVTITLGAAFTTQNNVHLWVVLDGILHRTALP